MSRKIVSVTGSVLRGVNSCSRGIISAVVGSSSGIVLVVCDVLIYSSSNLGISSGRKCLFSVFGSKLFQSGIRGTLTLSPTLSQKTRLAIEKAGGTSLAWDISRSAVDHPDVVSSAALDAMQ